VSLATSLFDYPLPGHLIAQVPAAQRDESRLLVVDRAAHTLAHRRFRDLPEYVRAGDVLFRNNAAVLPARLQARRPTGGAVECFLLRPETDPAVWICLVKPGKKLPVGATFAGHGGAFTGEIMARHADGSASVHFTTPAGEAISAVANRVGDVPLPPYIERHDAGSRDRDRERYQTVYAETSRQVAVAAPTAGLHFTPELLATLAGQGIGFADVTLHVGLGTFRPISTETIDGHEIHREVYEIPAETLRVLAGASAHPSRKSEPARSGRRIAVGTTTVRTIEHYLAGNQGTAPDGVIAEADLFIYPTYRFRGVDALITNFHQPRSTLLCLVAAFLAPGSADGIAWLQEIYAEAVAREYRFFSYGDAMLIL
jgi:S-adenosylmethionine:tRNA ribosyltransferase-isomerase